MSRVRRALELYRALPEPPCPEDFALRIRALIEAPGQRVFDA